MLRCVIHQLTSLKMPCGNLEFSVQLREYVPSYVPKYCTVAYSSTTHHRVPRLSSSNDTRLPQPSPSLQQHPDDLLDHMEYFPRKACSSIRGCRSTLCRNGSSLIAAIGWERGLAGVGSLLISTLYGSSNSSSSSCCLMALSFIRPATGVGGFLAGLLGTSPSIARVWIDYSICFDGPRWLTASQDLATRRARPSSPILLRFTSSCSHATLHR
jgi:hypothetical protein